MRRTPCTDADVMTRFPDPLSPRSGAARDLPRAFDRHRKAEPHLEPGILREGASAGNLHRQRPPRSPLSS